MIIDAHYHLDERLETIDRLVNQMKINNIDKTSLIAAVCEPFKISWLANALTGLLRTLLLCKNKTIGKEKGANHILPPSKTETKIQKKGKR